MVSAVLPQPDAVIAENDHGMVTYQPRNAWFARTNPRVYTENGYHVSRANGASVEFTFTGTSIWVYGDTNSDHGEFEVRIDGGEPDRRTGFTPRWRIMQVLYTDTLPAGTHRINITNVSNFKAFSLDYFAYIPLADLNSSSSASPDPMHQPTSTATATSIRTSSSSSLPTGAIIGLVLGLLGMVLFAILGCLIVRDRRRRKESTRRNIIPWGYARVDLGAGARVGAGAAAGGPGRGPAVNPVQMRAAGGPVYPAPSSGYAYSRRPESYISVEPTLSDFPQSRAGASVITGPTVHGDRFADDEGTPGVPQRSQYFTITEGGTLTVGVRSPS